jgi:PAS domain S-box-containing protein
MIEKPLLVTNERIKGKPFTCKCSLCGRVFTPLDDGTPKEPMAELWRAFTAHVREVHGEDRIFDPIAPRNLDRRQWELWILALTVIFILAVGMALLMYPTAIYNDLIVDGTSERSLFFGFCALSVLLVGYLLDRQVASSRLSKRLAEEHQWGEEALRESDARFRVIFENAAIGIALVDLHGHLVEGNPALQKMLGYTNLELAGKAFTEYTHPDGVRADRDLFTELVEGKRDKYQIEQRFLRKDGQVVSGQLHVSMVRNQKGEFKYSIGMVEDISERKRTGEALRQLSGRLLRMQDQERRRIARELHDSTAQSLAALAINLNVVKDSAGDLNPRARACLSESLGLSEQCSREIRTLSYLMHPPLLDEAGLGSALRGFVGGYAHRTGIHVDLEMPTAPTNLPANVELALYRFVQEALTNVHRHSGSKRAHVCLRFRPDQAVLTVADEGHGIPPGVLERGSRRDEKLGIGISGMRERIRQLGGHFEIHTSSNGTTLTATVIVRQGQA